MLLEILTPNENVYSGEVKLVKIPGRNGSFEIMNNHAPLISTLANGEVKVETEAGEILNYRARGGVVEVKNNHIILLVESIEK